MLDTLAEGLEVFCLRSAFRAFPFLFKPLFVASRRCCQTDVLDILKFHHGDSWLEGDAGRVAGYLKRFIGSLEETGELIQFYLLLSFSCSFLGALPELLDFVRCVTGSPYCQGNTINVEFSADQDVPAFTFQTCAKQLTISEKISCEETFCLGLKAVMTQEFTTA